MSAIRYNGKNVKIPFVWVRRATSSHFRGLDGIFQHGWGRHPPRKRACPASLTRGAGRRAGRGGAGMSAAGVWGRAERVVVGVPRFPAFMGGVVRAGGIGNQEWEDGCSAPPPARRGDGARVRRPLSLAVSASWVQERCYVGNLLLFFMLRQGVSGFKGSATWVLARTPGWLESRDSLANGASHQQSRYSVGANR